MKLKRSEKEITKLNIAVMAIVLVIIIFCVVIYFTVQNNTSKETGFIYLKSVLSAKIDNEVLKKENYIFTSYEEYKKVFGTDKLSESDFKNSNYLLLNISYDPCSEKEITPTNYLVAGNNIKVSITYKSTCGGCASENVYYLLKVDKNITSPNVDIEYKETSKEECNPNISYKPLIYLYPTADTKVNVKLGRSEALTSTYPKYKDSWNVLAKTDGELIDDKGRSYYGLYWEGYNTIDVTFEDGFVVGRDNLIPFLEEKLRILGLTEREANEFIIYWLPKLEENEYNLIRFESIDKINKDMPLIINPKPDTVIRVLMEYKKADKDTKVKTQELVTPVRKGFTVVEWGGSIVK